MGVTHRARCAVRREKRGSHPEKPSWPVARDVYDGGYKGLQKIAKCYRGLQGVTLDYRWLQCVTWG